MKLSSRLLTSFSVVILLALIAGMSVYFMCPQPGEYVTASVRRGDIENAVLATGKLDASERVNVGAQVSGQVKSLHVSVGEYVHKGQLIAEIDNLPQRNDLRIAEAALSAARAERLAKQAMLKQNESQFRRQRHMLADDASSRQDYENAEAALSTARAELLALDARIVQAQVEVDRKNVDLSYTQILAPMDGTVIAVVTRHGQTLNANQSAPVIVKLAKLDVMTIKAQISEADITHVNVGQKAYFTIFSEPDKRYDASLKKIELAPESIMKEDALSGSSSSESSSSGTNASVYYNALLNVPNPDNKLRIAMSAQVMLLRDEAKNALLIPQQAVKETGNRQQQVTIIRTGGQPAIRSITTGITNGIDIQVLSGLQEGEQVVLAHATSMDGAMEGSVP